MAPFETLFNIFMIILDGYFSHKLLFEKFIGTKENYSSEGQIEDSYVCSTE